MTGESPAVISLGQRSFDLLPLGLCLLDRSLTVYSWNQTLEQWTGIPREQMIGRCYGDGLPDAAVAPLRDRVQAVLDGEGGEESFCPLHASFDRNPLRNGNGRLEMMQRTTVRCFDPSDELVLVIIEDVTTEFEQIQELLAERKMLRTTMRQLEEQTCALRDSEERFNLAVRGSSDGIWDWNVLTNEVYYSPRFKELIGYRAHEFENGFASFQSHFHPADSSGALRLIFAHVESKQPLDIELRMHTKAGEWRWFRVRAQAIAGSDGRAIRMAGSLTDVTEQKNAEGALQRYAIEAEESRGRIEAQAATLSEQAAELELARRRAEQASQSKSEFLANMSHEIRTPMTSILGFTDLLLIEEGIDSAPPERVSALETIKRNGEHLLELINDILDVSKIEASRLTIERIRFSPAKLVTDVVALMKIRADAKQLDLGATIAGPIPEMIESDPTRLRQILINLVGNAIKFTERGHVQIRVRYVPNEPDVSRIEFMVSDSGIGLGPEQLACLFRPFTQADASTTRKFGGTGLGLSISKRFAELLGGDIKVESERGKGSTFSVSIRAGSLDGVRLIDAAVPTLKPPAGVSTPARDVPKVNCRVLVAEDGPDNQRLLSFLLTKAGAEVTVAEDGQMALDKVLHCDVGERPFEIILMDMQMPVMDGYTAARRLREAGYRGVIIALTAHAMRLDREKCLAAGCDDYATKPIDRVKLLTTIAELHRRKGGPSGGIRDSHAPESMPPGPSGNPDQWT